MKAMFVRDVYIHPYAMWIVTGKKRIETRYKNMLKPLVGERVAVVRTMNGKPPMVVGYVDVTEAWFCERDKFSDYVNEHLVCGRYYADKRGKWMYELRNAVECVPFLLPSDSIRHGRSWCEF